MMFESTVKVSCDWPREARCCEITNALNRQLQDAECEVPKGYYVCTVRDATQDEIKAFMTQAKLNEDWKKHK